MSGDAEQEYFADGISEDIITALSKLSQLFVIARNSSFTFKGRNVHIGEVGKSLGVRYVLEGSVRKSGARVRITAQLVDATTGGHLWAERFDRELTDIFAVQDDVTTQIVAALALNLSSGDRQSIAVEHSDQEAYDCFLRGRELFFRTTRDANREAGNLLRRAIQLDPRYAPAHALLAAAHVIDYANGWTASPTQALEEAEKAARQAVQLNERHPYALWALALTSLWARRYDEALGNAEKAVAFNPNFADGHTARGFILHHVGRSEEALKCFERAVVLEPYFPDIWLHFRAQALHHLGRYPEAVGLLKRRILRNPDTDASRALLAASYGQMCLIDEAREAWRELLRVNPKYSIEQRRKVLPYKNPEDFERVVEGLRKAGLPKGPAGDNRNRERCDWLRRPIHDGGGIGYWIWMIDSSAIRERFAALSRHLRERDRRLWAASEARAAGYGGIAAVSAATGIAASTIGRGLKELASADTLDVGRVRRRGGGRQPLVKKDATLLADLLALVIRVSAAIRCRRCAGLAKACRSWRRLWRRKATGSAARWSASCCTSRNSACRPIARPGKATAIPIAMRSSFTSTTPWLRRWPRANR